MVIISSSMNMKMGEPFAQRRVFMRRGADYGAVVLCDARFGARLSGLSSWLRPQAPCLLWVESLLQVQHKELEQTLQERRSFVDYYVKFYIISYLSCYTLLELL